MELDGYCEFLDIAFEHHGDQHYVDGTLFTCGDDFLARRKEDDAAKARLCRERRITLVVVPQIPERTSIDEVTGVIIEQLLSAGISIPPEFDPSDLDLTYAYSTPPSLSNLDALRRIALDRGGKCLSREYRGAHQKMDWECGRCGHQWSATAASVRAGSWCKVCGHKAGTRKRSLGIELMHSIAKQRGGSCLSTEYANANTPLEWECKEGHRWSATPHMVKNGKTWCAICYGERRRRLR
jgi:DNA-directed RNA polymerase subunit RPC12/RpoP